MSTKRGTYTRTERQTDRRTDGRTDKANTICPADFRQAGHKNAKVPTLSSLFDHIGKFYNISNG